MTAATATEPALPADLLERVLEKLGLGEWRREVIHALEVDPLLFEKLHELPACGSGRLLVDGDDVGHR